MGGKDDKDHKIGRQCYNRNAGRVQRNMFSYRGLTLLIPCRFLTGFTVENIKYARGVKNTFFSLLFLLLSPYTSNVYETLPSNSTYFSLHPYIITFPTNEKTINLKLSFVEIFTRSTYC